MPTTYTEFTFTPSTAGKFAVICAPASMVGQIQIRRLTIQAPGANRVRLTRHTANASGGSTPPVYPLVDGGAAPRTVVRVYPGVTPPNAPELVMTPHVKADKSFAESAIDPTDGGMIGIAANHSIVLEFLDDHNAEYRISLEFEEPAI